MFLFGGVRGLYGSKSLRDSNHSQALEVPGSDEEDSEHWILDVTDVCSLLRAKRIEYFGKPYLTVQTLLIKNGSVASCRLGFYTPELYQAALAKTK